MIVVDTTEIVVIDDDADLRMLTTLAFEIQGWTVETASDGVAGLELLAAHTAAGYQPVVLLDVQMPEIDGWEVLRRIRSDPVLEPLPVLLCTVRAGEADIKRGMGLGADGFVAKPFDIDDLVDAVREVRHRPAAIRAVERSVRSRMA